MSRGLLIATAVVLLGLLGVMSFALNKTTAPPPPPKAPDNKEELATKKIIDANQKKAQMDQRRDMTKSRMKSEEDTKKSFQAIAKKAGVKADYKVMGGLDITASWHTSRPSGEAGIKQLHHDNDVRERLMKEMQKNKSSLAPPPLETPDKMQAQPAGGGHVHKEGDGHKH